MREIDYLTLSLCLFSLVISLGLAGSLRRLKERILFLDIKIEFLSEDILEKKEIVHEIARFERLKREKIK